MEFFNQEQKTQTVLKSKNLKNDIVRSITVRIQRKKYAVRFFFWVVFQKSPCLISVLCQMECWFIFWRATEDYWGSKVYIWYNPSIFEFSNELESCKRGSRVSVSRQLYVAAAAAVKNAKWKFFCLMDWLGWPVGLPLPPPAFCLSLVHFWAILGGKKSSRSS